MFTHTKSIISMLSRITYYSSSENSRIIHPVIFWIFPIGNKSHKKTLTGLYEV